MNAVISLPAAAAAAVASQDGWSHYLAGRIEPARAAAHRRLQDQPEDADAWLLLAACLRAERKLFEAEAVFGHAGRLAPSRADIPLNLGHLLRSQARYAEAVACFQEARALAPAQPAVHLALCEALVDAGQAAEAATEAHRAVAAGITSPELLQALGNARFTLGDHTGALAAYETALGAAPEHVSLLYNAALAHHRLGRREAALSRLQTLTARQPGHINAHIKQGDLHKELGDPTAAAASYRAALAIQEALPEVHNNLGASLARLGRWREAITSYRRAVELGLRAPVLFANLGNAHQALRELPEALAAYREGLALAPDDVALRTEAVHVQQKLCDWAELDHLRATLVEPALDWAGPGTPPSPFVFLALPQPVSAAEQLAIARRYAAHVAAAAPTPLPPRPTREPGPLRVGYLSADFHNHATAHLMLGLFRRHDRQAFRIHAYSLGPDDGSGYRRRIQADCDAFVDLSTLSDRAAAERIRADGVDILVDLKGYTGSARPAILAWRPAPVQAQWLGYPGTLGAAWIDYILADKTVLPESDTRFYSEAPVWLPASYQVNDRDQPIAAPSPSRAACGLPEEGFVFCCFNSPYKIEPLIFGVWMQLLRAVPGSVLWLYAGNPAACANLQAEAARRGIDPARLIFAPSLPKAEHLARHQHADIFLDTLFYNAHTTASDALWAGVPVLTAPGDTFASRVCAGLLQAVGLPELVCPDLAAYAARALLLARQPEMLAKLRQKLAQQRLTAPLFDTDHFARALDHALVAMWLRHEQEQPPGPITVEP